jgi:hypothetical protein
MQMKALFLTAISLFAIAACTEQAAGPTTVAGSAANTTTAFDGTYRGISIRADSGVGSGLKLADPYTTGCQPFTAPPAMTITNGLAQFQAVGATFSGYVTPQGNLTMDSGRGATVSVTFDPQTRVFRGQANSVNCRYDVAWQKA